MAFWAQSSRHVIYSLHRTLCCFFMSGRSTLALSRWFGRRRTRDRFIFLLKVVYDSVVGGRQLGAGCAFSARLSSSSSRRSCGGMTSTACSACARACSARALRAVAYLCMRMARPLRTVVCVVTGACTIAVPVVWPVFCIHFYMLNTMLRDGLINYFAIS